MIAVLLLVLVPAAARAHHGVASLGAAGLEGPGAPIETSVSSTLPSKSVLGYAKLDYASFEKFTPERDDEGDYNAFWMFGAGYGATSWLSLYAFAPFYTKTVEDNSFNTSGFADPSFMGVFGFKYDEGLRLTPDAESLDDWEDWHFTLFGGFTVPTGKANLKNADGEIDPGMSLGFGKPAGSIGLTTTKVFLSRWTWDLEVSYLFFQEYEYDDGNRTRFGDEVRVNGAIVARLLTKAAAEFRLDASLEGHYLKLGRDEANGEGELGTGGKMIYAVPGLRAYYKNSSLGVGIKLPAWTDLNEDDIQQGAEGKENYRALVTFSVLL
jgi:hypothetical protein